MDEEQRRQLNNLIRAVADGKAQSLDGIFLIAAKRMTAVAQAIVGDRSTAEDVVSESFIKIARFARRYSGDQPMAWILALVRNTALDALRKKNRRGEVSEEAFFTIADDSYSPEKRENALMLESAVKGLPPDERKAIFLRYYCDMTVRDAAAELGCTRSAAERLIKRAENNLKILLQGGKIRK